MKNRWSDAARLAALAVRKARAFAANPDKGNAVPQPGGRAPKPMAPKPTAFAGGSATLDERTGARLDGSIAGPKPVAKVPYAKDNVPGNPGLHIWIPPPNDPHWNDPAFVESFNRGVAERKKAGLAAGTFPTQPNIFYSSAVPGPLDRQVPQGGIRYDPQNPDHPQSPMPPKRPPGGGTGKTKTTDGTRVIIGGLRYTRVGNKLVPDVIDKSGKVKNFYLK